MSSTSHPERSVHADAPPALDVAEPDQLVEVTSYAEVIEAFRLSAKLAVVTDRLSAPIRAGTVLRIDGDAHAKRRRTLNRLVFRGGHQRLRERVLHPAVERELAGLRSRPDPDGNVRFDVAALCTRVLTEVVAAMIGLEDVGGGEGVAQLLRISACLEEFARLRTQLKGVVAAPAPDEIALALARAEDGKREFAERFYRPALERRRRLLARHEAGGLAESELPNDFLMLVAAHADPSFAEDPDLGVRHAIIDLLHAGTGTTVGAVVWTIEELARHLADHPAVDALLTDPRFLLGAVNEVLRLHAANPAEIRRALEDVTLSGGTRIRAGHYAVLRTGAANRDRSVFGPDADRFDPHRTVPAGVYAHGLAFGSGPHMCYGIPLALGDEGVDGNIVFLARALYAAGVERDPDRHARFRPAIAHADLKSFETYPARLAQSRAFGPETRSGLDVLTRTAGRHRRQLAASDERGEAAPRSRSS